MDEDSGTTSIPVLANDSDPDGDPFRITAVTQPSVGTVTFTDGAVSFTPNADANGMATFTYTVSDPGGATDRAIVSVTVRPINDAPVAADDQLTVTEDSGGTVTNVVANDRDVDGDTLTITAVTQPKKGKVTFSGHNVSFTPNADANGSDSFTYTVSDGNGASDTATVAVTITPVDDPPVALNDSMTIRKGYEQRDVFFNVISGTQGGGWTGSDSFNGGRDRDVDGDAMSYVGPANPSSGVTGVAVQCASHGLCQVRTLNYVCGTFTFSWTYRVQAGGATSNFATVTVRVEAQSCIT